ncbi:GPN-loop GTPase QQT1-like [Argentina anserina]|uniref:GPN-loop GTPase QQT1-like n=1 Tax=Argentina anserina TaxID=57926 RepID=UPI00217664E7|nr:GPN-loop GTPase QQT1-like [Potentilla anserina]
MILSINVTADHLVAVHLVDSHLCSDPAKYVSALLLSLSTMIHMELPHINVLSKIDLIQNYGELAFNLDFYTDVEDLSYLQNSLDQDPRSAKFRKLTKELCGVIEDYSLVSFTTLDNKDLNQDGYERLQLLWGSFNLAGRVSIFWRMK